MEKNPKTPSEWWKTFEGRQQRFRELLEQRIIEDERIRAEQEKRGEKP